ncbi:hypothetical protein [Microbacterium sp. GCS4]|uniref:hypothetical protein n=1 Tax=Microbacterium sp. GCS4 TaxID=1692239 RepID=UPI000B1C22B0|nr:hypothetical protein [Microbacterium sp. GCS4]
MLAAERVSGTNRGSTVASSTTIASIVPRAFATIDATPSAARSRMYTAAVRASG